MSISDREAKHVHGIIDLRQWELGEAIGKKMADDYLADVSETLRLEFEKRPPEISFPFYWSKGDGYSRDVVISDVATLYIEFPLGETEEDQVVYSVSLEGAIDDVIDMESTHDGVTKSGWETCHRLAERLRELADKLDNAPRSKHWNDKET